MKIGAVDWRPSDGARAGIGSGEGPPRPQGAGAEGHPPAAARGAGGAAAGAVVHDFRTTIMAAEQVANPGKLNVGVMTTDGTHPNDAGKTYMCNDLFPHFTFS